MKIPKRVKIGDSTYNIKMQRFIAFLNPAVSGQIDYHNGVVKIKKPLITEQWKILFFMRWRTGY